MYEKTRQLVASLYKDSATGWPLVLTDGQCELFDLIFKKKHPRLHIRAYTQYGKSLVIALAILTRIGIYAEKWCVVAGTQRQAKIIVGYIIEHTFDNPLAHAQLQLDRQESLDQLRRERSKNHLSYKHSDGSLGEVMVLSGDSGSKNAAGLSLSGFGAPNIVLDEAPLVDNVIEAMVFRMLGGYRDNFYCKIGNPYERNHFWRDFLDPNYVKMNIIWRQGVAEGRITEAQVDEARRRPLFAVLYENEFPPENAVDDENYSPLILEDDLNRALVELPECAWFGERALGWDVARGGGNFSVWTLRTRNYATQLGRNQSDDLMGQVGVTIQLMRENKVLGENIFVDDTGIGGGPTARIREQSINCNAVTLAERADDPVHYVNRRAENFWRLRQWLNEGGKLNPKQDWSELLQIKTKPHGSNGRLMIMPKEKMLTHGIPSTDIADSLMLTFDRPPFSREEEMINQIQEAENFDPYKSSSF